MFQFVFTSAQMRDWDNLIEFFIFVFMSLLILCFLSHIYYSPIRVLTVSGSKPLPIFSCQPALLIVHDLSSKLALLFVVFGIHLDTQIE